MIMQIAYSQGDDTMEIFSCGTNFPHTKGEFCMKTIRDSFFISCFSTSFLYESDGRMLTGNVGDILIMPPGTVIYHGPKNENEQFINDWIYLDGSDFRDLLARYPLPEKTAFQISDPILLKNCIAQIEEELLLKHIGYQEVISSCLTQTIIRLHRLYEQQLHSGSPMLRIEAVREAFLRHPEKNWSLQDMAELCEYSVSRFCSLYCQRFGCSPKADLLEHRLNLAKQLLCYTECTITEISERCGFHSIYYFSKYFKENEGCTPSEYARNFKTISK